MKVTDKIVEKHGLKQEEYRSIKKFGSLFKIFLILLNSSKFNPCFSTMSLVIFILVKQT